MLVDSAQSVYENVRCFPICFSETRTVHDGSLMLSFAVTFHIHSLFHPQICWNSVTGMQNSSVQGLETTRVKPLSKQFSSFSQWNLLSHWITFVVQEFLHKCSGLHAIKSPLVSDNLAAVYKLSSTGKDPTVCMRTILSVHVWLDLSNLQLCRPGPTWLVIFNFQMLRDI